MDAAKRLQLYFVSLQREDPPTKVESLRKVSFVLSPLLLSDSLQRDGLKLMFPQEVTMLEGELKTKTVLVKKQERLIQEWRTTLKGQLDKLNNELERV